MNIQAFYVAELTCVLKKTVDLATPNGVWPVSLALKVIFLLHIVGLQPRLLLASAALIIIFRPSLLMEK